jgi:hypothetical protein
MEEKVMFLLISIFVSILTNLLVLKFFKRKIFVVELFIFLFIFIIFFILFIKSFNNFFEILFYFSIFISTLGTYTFTMIMIFEGSPSLNILLQIKKDKKVNKQKIFNIFKKNEFFKSRFNDLKKKKYIVIKNSKIHLEKRKNWLVSFFVNLEKMQRNKNNG